MGHIHPGPDHLRTSSNLHHAAGISGSHHLGARIQDGLDLVLTDPSSQLRVGDSVDSCPPAALVMPLQLDQLQTWYGPQKDQRFVGNPLGV